MLLAWSVRAWRARAVTPGVAYSTPKFNHIDSAIADMKNTGGRPGGSITAAMFIQRFVNKVPWAHLDIASTAWKKPSTVPTIPDGATGFGVRLLNRMVADRYEG